MVGCMKDQKWLKIAMIVTKLKYFKKWKVRIPIIEF